MSRSYTEAQREAARVRARRWRARNPEKVAAMKRRYYERNKAKMNARSMQWRRDNRERHLATQAAWRERNPHKTRAAWRRYSPFRVQRGMHHGYVRVLRNDPCSYCGGPAGESDHIVPVSHGGTGDWENLTAACRSCNASKNARSLLTYLLAA